MKSLPKRVLITLLAFCGVLTAVYAATPITKTEHRGNSYYFYSKSLDVSDSGVAAIPPRFKWSVETSWRGIDLQGNDLPDSRVMLRLYDPDHNFTALTAQMSLATATKLHHELGEIIVKKLHNSDYQFRPQLYRPDQIPTKQIIGIDADGTAIVEDVDKAK